MPKIIGLNTSRDRLLGLSKAATAPVGGIPYDNFFAWATDELAKPQAPWFIDQMVMPRGLTIVAGKQKLGKSFLSVCMAIAMSTGKPIGIIKPMGRTKSLYFDMEGSAQKTAQRMQTLCVGHGIPWTQESLQFANMAKQRDFQLLADGNASVLGDTLRRDSIEVVFLDTIARSFQGEENNKKEIQKYLDTLSELRNSLGIAVVLVHHMNKESYFGKNPVFMDPDAGMRGSSAIGGAYDVAFTLGEGYIEGEHQRFMMSRGKYTSDWYANFRVQGEKGPDGEFTKSWLDFGSRQEEFTLVSPVPDSQRYGGAGGKSSLGGKGFGRKGGEPEEYPR